MVLYAAAAAAAEKNKIKYPVLRNSFWPLTQASEFSPCKSNIGRVQRERVQYYTHTPKYRTCHLILWEGKSPENKDAIYIYKMGRAKSDWPFIRRNKITTHTHTPLTLKYISASSLYIAIKKSAVYTTSCYKIAACWKLMR